MPSKKKSEKSTAKKPGKARDNQLSDKDLEDVAGGVISEPTLAESGDDAILRKRPGRVKSLHQDP